MPSSTREVVAPRATTITRSTNPSYYGLPRRPDHHHHPRMMSILDHPAHTTIHRGLVSTGSMPMSFNRMNSPCALNISQFAVPPTHFPPHDYVTSSSPLEEGLSYHGQAVTQGQSSASTSNYHLSSPSSYHQINAAVPEMAENTRNTFSYSAPAGTPHDSTQVASPVTMWPTHACSAPDPYHNTSSLRNASYDDPTQTSTASWLYGVPAMGNHSQLPYSPSMQSSDIRIPHGPQQQWQGTSYYPPPTDYLPSQPNLPMTFKSQPGINRGDHANSPSCPLPQSRQHHGEGPHQGSHNSSRSHTQESRPCRWLGCVFEGSIDALKTHLINSHLNGPQDAQIECLWDGCDYFRRGKPGVRTMRRDSAWRHVLEIHLGVKYRKKIQGT
ncbi:hypothetical protein K503DRAFT_409839 [Rhizopogon vinicolor AM-OR11-026]|uniref:Uncharacterized protein n=1 Tax=Rhizopogon vinicolor AM-OR11-026 TaxID=1314800 RepID=A0A1B7MQQ1_9AGAM|nr:hypothetical protein K503DRAFT_409839 [Rhizopogon vinicolor AM-OR11-026]